jgi:hypothetical protein
MFTYREVIGWRSFGSLPRPEVAAVPRPVPKNGWNRAAFYLLILGIVLGAASIGCFVEGMFSVKAAITSLKPQS